MKGEANKVGARIEAKVPLLGLANSRGAGRSCAGYTFVDWSLSDNVSRRGGNGVASPSDGSPIGKSRREAAVTKARLLKGKPISG